MKIKILFDREGIGKKFSIGWGFSCLVDEIILFYAFQEKIQGYRGTSQKK